MDNYKRIRNTLDECISDLMIDAEVYKYEGEARRLSDHVIRVLEAELRLIKVVEVRND